MNPFIFSFPIFQKNSPFVHPFSSSQSSSAWRRDVSIGALSFFAGACLAWNDVSLVPFVKVEGASMMPTVIPPKSKDDSITVVAYFASSQITSILVW